MFSIDGLVSGFDTSSIIESLLGFQQAQVDTFNARKAEITTKQASFKGIESQLLTMQGSLGRLNRLSDSVFDVTNATSTHEDIIVAVSDSGAAEGSYQLTVESLATAQQIGSQGFESTSDTIATGEIGIRVGDSAETTISITAQNNTLDGLAQAINEQSPDVGATIIFDQGSDSYRLLLTSDHTGADNVISVTSNLDADSGVIPDFSGPAVQEAQDAVVRLGSGPGAITASYASNQIDELIEDVTLDLKQADVDTTVTLEITADRDAAKEAIETFVSDFNATIEFIDEQTRYDPATERANPLLGERSVSTLKNRLLTAVTSTVDNPSDLKRLGQIGIDVNLQGKLEIDSNKLDKALRGDLDGISSRDIRNIFGLNAKSSNSGIRFVAGGTRTNASESAYEVDITQAAEQAIIQGSTALAETLVVDESNRNIQITVDGIVSETLQLSTGSYSRDEFSRHLQSVVNASDELGFHEVTTNVNSDGQLVIRSNAYGSDSALSSVTGSALSLLGLTGTESDSGQDVQGSFIVNGETEIAKGNGRLLVGDPDNENTADLQLLVSLTSEQVSSGSEGTIDVSRGVTGQLDKYLSSVLNAERGLLKTTEESFNLRIDSIDESIKRVEDITASKRDFLIAEFTALESIISDLQNTGTFISSQLATISSSSNNKK